MRRIVDDSLQTPVDCVIFFYPGLDIPLLVDLYQVGLLQPVFNELGQRQMAEGDGRLKGIMLTFSHIVRPW